MILLDPIVSPGDTSLTSRACCWLSSRARFSSVVSLRCFPSLSFFCFVFDRAMADIYARVDCLHSRVSVGDETLLSECMVLASPCSPHLVPPVLPRLVVKMHQRTRGQTPETLNYYYPNPQLSEDLFWSRLPRRYYLEPSWTFNWHTPPIGQANNRGSSEHPTSIHAPPPAHKLSTGPDGHLPPPQRQRWVANLV